MINPYVWIGIGAIWLASLTGMFVWRGNEVEQVTNAKWTQRELDQVTAANKLLKDTEESYRVSEKAWAANQAAIVTKYTKEQQDAKAKSDAVIAGLRNGSIGVSFTRPASPRCADSPNLSSTPASVARSDATETIQLPREIGANIYSLASDADAVADQLRTCQALIVADRAK